MTRIRIQVLALVALASTLTYAQQDNKKGYLTGSFETNTIYYKDDSKTKAESPEDHFGSNNYLKLDYYQGKFEEAAKTARTLIESGKHALLSDYEQLWKNTCNGVWRSFRTSESPLWKSDADISRSRNNCFTELLTESSGKIFIRHTNPDTAIFGQQIRC